MLLEVHQKGVAARLMAVVAVFALALGFVYAKTGQAYAEEPLNILKVTAADVDIPEIGKTPDFQCNLVIECNSAEIHLADPDQVLTNPMTFETKPEWYEDGVRMQPEATFLSGHTYKASHSVYRRYSTLYHFPVSTEGAMAYVNDTEMGTVTHGANDSWHRIGMTAEWTLYGITYEPNGGTGEAKTQTVYDKTTTLPTNSEFIQFTRDGYTFAGWSTTKEGKVEYADGASYTFPEDTATVTLYALWVPATYKVTVTPDPAKGGTAIADKQEATAGETVTLSATPAEGYEFVEWKTANAGVTIADGKFTMPGSDVEVTAIFKEKPAPVTTCSVSFKANGGSGTMDSLSGEKGSTVKLTANKFTRTGYTFTGWNTDKDGKGTSYVDKASLKLDSDITLYAQWKKNATTTSKSSGTGTLANTSDPTSIASLAVSASAAAAAFGARAFTRRKTH